MLLNNAIAAQQSLYSQLQIQIDELQAKQREIQAYMQQLGSVESSMESAAQMLQQAIAEIRAVCPDELGNYQTLITSMFNDVPIAQLTAVVDDNTDPDPKTDPTDPTNDSIAVDAVAVVTDNSDSAPQPVPQADSTPQTNETQSEVATTVILPNPTTRPDFPTVSQVSNMRKTDVQYWLNEVGESIDGKIGELRTRLNAYIMSHRTLKKTAS